jgi:hypothetical protein
VQHEAGRLEAEVAEEGRRTQKAWRGKEDKQKKLEQALGSLEVRHSRATAREQELMSLEAKLKGELRSRIAELGEVRRGNEEAEALDVDRLTRQLEIDTRLLLNYIEENDILKQKLAKLGGSEALKVSFLEVEHLLVESPYTGLTQSEMQRLIQEKERVVQEQREGIEQLGRKLGLAAGQLRGSPDSRIMSGQRR